MTHRLLVLALAAGLAGCGGRSAETTDSPVPGAAAFQALPDTTVCVVDRTTQRGLRNLAAKRGAGGEALLRLGGEIVPLNRVHPLGVVAGYAANEAWVASGDPIRLDGRRYLPVGGERLITIEQLQQSGEYQAYPYFADPNDAAPLDAVYLPSRPGCVFRAFVREDLMGG